MSRSYDISDFAAFLRKYGASGHDRVDRTEDSLRDGSHRTGPDCDRQQHSSQSCTGDDRSRMIYRGRGREYSLRESEVQTLADLGKFRIVPADDLARLTAKEEQKGNMAIIKALPKQPKTVTIQARVEESIKTQLDNYAKFIDSSTSYVITEALKLLFKRDQEFKRWSGQNTNNHNQEQIQGGVLTKIA